MKVFTISLSFYPSCHFINIVTSNSCLLSVFFRMVLLHCSNMVQFISKAFHSSLTVFRVHDVLALSTNSQKFGSHTLHNRVTFVILSSGSPLIHRNLPHYVAYFWRQRLIHATAHPSILLSSLQHSVLHGFQLTTARDSMLTAYIRCQSDINFYRRHR
jgi:hypothetical protein